MIPHLYCHHLILFYTRFFCQKVLLDMHIFRNFIPFNKETRTMYAKYRTGRIIHISLTVISNFFDNFFRIMARLITF